MNRVLLVFLTAITVFVTPSIAQKPQQLLTPDNTEPPQAAPTVVLTHPDGAWQTIHMGDEPVEIFRDGYGVPHVFAKSFKGIFFGQGYASAQDRLWQSEMYRRDAKGELAELFGASQLDHDKRARSQSRTEAERLRTFERLSPDLRLSIEGLRDGINACIAQAIESNALPPDYASIKDASGKPAVPRSWTVTDTIAVAEMMSRRFGSGGTEEVELHGFLNRLIEKYGGTAGKAIFDDVAPRNDKDAPTTMPKTYRIRYESAMSGNGKQRTVGSGQSAWENQINSVVNPANRHLLTAYLDGWREDLKTAEAIGSFTKLGSNAWVVAPSRSATKNAILFGGPMMGFRAPQIAYEIHLSGPAHPDGSGAMNVLGMAFAGLPTVLIGHNELMAWTTTSGSGNVSDLYVETLNPLNPTQYKFQGEWRNAEKITEKISVRQEDGSLKEVAHDVYRTVHGPVVSLDLKTATAVSVKHSFWQDEAYTISNAFLELNRATSVEDFWRGCSTIQTTHNFFYADREGNIAYAWVGKYPIRPEGTDWRLPLRGTGEDEWKGYLTFDQLPKSLNPEQGYLANWNNKPSDEWESLFGRVFWGHRIYKRLAADDSMTLQEATDIARETGTNDFLADYFRAYLLRSTRMPSMGGIPEATEIARIAQNYDVIAGVGSAGERIYDTFVNALLKAMFADELPFLFERKLDEESFLMLASLALRILEPETAYLKPSRDYLNGESAEEVLERALTATIETLGMDSSKWGAEPRQIKMGEKIAVPWARRGTYMQAVELSAPRVQGWNILPPGQSENPESAHSADQVELFRNWEYKPTCLWREELGRE